MKRLNSIVTMTAVAMVALPAAFAAGHVPIATTQIAAAISSAGMPVLPQQVTLLTEVRAATSVPALKVDSMERQGDSRVLVRLSCTDTEQCLPFFVAVRGDANTVQQPDTTTPKSKSSNEAIVMRSGSPATLFLEGHRIHIRLTVVCIESGAVGQTIRVASKDHKMTYQAEVVDGTTLKGRL